MAAVSKKKTALIACLCLSCMAMLAACSPSYEQKHYPVLPEELKDCRFFQITSGSGAYITVVRCPNSSTTTRYSYGKTMAQTVVVENSSEI